MSEVPRLQGGASKKFIGWGEKSPKPPRKGAIHPLAQQGVFWHSFITYCCSKIINKQGKAL